MKILTATTAAILCLASLANAKTVCKEYEVSGDLQVTQICAQMNLDGTFSKPELSASNGISWRISKGLIPQNRANRICHALGLGKIISYSVSNCPQEQSALNLKGEYSSSILFAYGTGDCIEQVKCNPPNH